MSTTSTPFHKSFLFRVQAPFFLVGVALVIASLLTGNPGLLLPGIIVAAATALSLTLFGLGLRSLDKTDKWVHDHRPASTGYSMIQVDKALDPAAKRDFGALLVFDHDGIEMIAEPSRSTILRATWEEVNLVEGHDYHLTASMVMDAATVTLTDGRSFTAYTYGRGGSPLSNQIIMARPQHKPWGWAESGVEGQ